MLSIPLLKGLRNKFIYFLSIFFLSFSYNINAQANLVVNVGTFHAPPFSMNEDGQHLGLAHDAVKKLLADSKLSFVQEIYPLGRGLLELSYGRIDLFYPYITFEKDPKNVILLGPISVYKLGFFSNSNTAGNISLTNLDKFKIVAEQDAVPMKIIQEYTPSTRSVPRILSCLNMVIAKRSDLCFANELSGKYMAAINGLYDKLDYHDTQLTAHVYLALSAHLDPGIVITLRSEFKRLQENKFFIDNQKDYEEKFKIFIESMTEVN